jgi:hypothetical protein
MIQNSKKLTLNQETVRLLTSNGTQKNDSGIPETCSNVSQDISCEIWCSWDMLCNQ